MSIDTITEQEVEVCARLAERQLIEKHPDRGLLIVNNPCYAIQPSGKGDNARVKYALKPCDGRDTNCPGHPQYQK